MHFACYILSLLISIHALLAESDKQKADSAEGLPYFYPRSPCGERRCQGGHTQLRCAHFYPRSPCGERPISAL